MDYKDIMDIASKINRSKPNIGVSGNGKLFGISVEKLNEYFENRIKNANRLLNHSVDPYDSARGAEEVTQVRKEAKIFSTVSYGGKTFFEKYGGEYGAPSPKPSNQREDIVMTEKELNHIRQQFKNIGAEKAFTPELIATLKQGVAVKEHPYQFDNNGDKAEVVFHLKKSQNSNLYFLNKYDMSVTKENKNAEATQTFYVSNDNKVNLQPGEKMLSNLNRFTIKKAANYLAGRPVFMAFTDKESNQYEAWAKRKFNVSKGHFEMVKYRKEYPFDMKNAVKNYSIKELTVPEYTERLYDSYKRGNLQLVTFVGDGGKEEKLYTSLNIGVISGGSLDVYDLNKDKLSVQQLADKGYIGNDFAQQLKERLLKPVDQQKEKIKDEALKVEKPEARKHVNKQKMS